MCCHKQEIVARSCDTCQIEQAQKSARYPGESLCLFYLFGQERIQRAGAGWIATARTGGVSRGTPSLWLWFSNRGEQHPCWHTTFPRKV